MNGAWYLNIFGAVMNIEKKNCTNFPVTVSKNKGT